MQMCIRDSIKRTMEQARMEMDILSKVYSKVRLLSRDELCVDNSDDACWREDVYKRQDADCESSSYGISGLEAEPHGSECIADCSSDDHCNYLNPSLMKFVNDYTCNNCHWNKADDISACRTGEFSDSTGKTGEYRKTGKSE